MRFIAVIALLFVSMSLKAQTLMPLSFMDFTRQQPFTRYHQTTDSSFKKKWFVTSAIGFSTGFVFSGNGNATITALPVTVQLNRKLTNNLYAFAGLTAAPVFAGFNQRFLTTDINKYPGGFLQPNKMATYTRADLGLRYVNDEGTFSISGSIGIERNNYSMFAPYQNTRRNQTIGTSR